jgi:hypothetical protein
LKLSQTGINIGPKREERKESILAAIRARSLRLTDGRAGRPPISRKLGDMGALLTGGTAQELE